MKKTYFFMLCAGLVLAGCTSKEQDEKIKAFWGQQVVGVMMKTPGSSPTMLQKALPLSVTQSAAAHPQNTPAQAQNPVENTAVTPGATSPKTAPKTQRPPVQVLDVTVEEDVLPGKASYADRVRMTRALENVQDNNQETLKDLQATFGDNVKTSAFYITLTTERKLKKAAAVALNYKDYAARQKQILAEQDQSIQQLMQQNTGSLRRIKKSSARN